MMEGTTKQPTEVLPATVSTPWTPPPATVVTSTKAPTEAPHATVITKVPTEPQLATAITSTITPTEPPPATVITSIKAPIEPPPATVTTSTKAPTEPSPTIEITSAKPSTAQNNSVEPVTTPSVDKSTLSTHTTPSKVTEIPFIVPSTYNSSTSESNKTISRYTTEPTESELVSEQQFAMTSTVKDLSVTSTDKDLQETSSEKSKDTAEHSEVEVHDEFESTTSITEGSTEVANSGQKEKESLQDKKTISTTEGGTGTDLVQQTTEESTPSTEMMETTSVSEEVLLTKETEKHESRRDESFETTEGTEKTVGGEDEIVADSQAIISSTTQKSTTKTTPAENVTDVIQATDKTTSKKNPTSTTETAVKTTSTEKITEVTHSTAKTTTTTEKTTETIKATIMTASEAPLPENICTSPECKVIASRMLSLINYTVDACEDFYVYACGGLRTSKTLLEENPSEDVRSRVTKQLKSVTKSSPASHQRLKEFYESCMSYDHTVPIQERKRQAKEKFDEFGKMITNGSAGDLTSLLIKLFLNGSAPLFDIQLDVDATDASKLAIVLTKPRLHSSYFQTTADNSKRCVHSSEDINDKLSVAYKNYLACKNNHSEFIAKTQEALEAFGAFEELGHERAAKSIWDLRFSVEANILGLLRALPSEMKIREIITDKKFKEYTVNDLQGKYKDIKWSVLFSALFGKDVSEGTKVQLYFEEFFDNMFNSFNYIQPVTLHNSLLAVLAHNLYTDLVQTNSPCDRERYCFEVAGNLMAEIMSNIYLASFTESELQHVVKEAGDIFTSLIKTMKEDVYDSKSRWLDEDSQNSVIQKLDNMTFEVAQRFSEVDLESNMNGIILNSTQYLLNAVTLERLRIKQYFSMYSLNPRNPQVIWLLFTKSFSPGVTYIHNINTLAIPLTQLAPLNIISIPKYIKMAKTGLLIGQGIGSAFTNLGVTFNINGQRGSIFSEHYDQPSYEFSMSDCDVYYNYEHSYKEDNKIYSFTQEGSLTKHNRLHDITGTNMVLETEQKDEGFKTKLPWGDFSPMKTFFILLAQEYCSKKGLPETFQALYEDDVLPPAFRVKNIVANSKEFVSTFNCPHGSSMNNQLKCPPFPKLQMYEDMYVTRELQPDLKRRYYQLMSRKINDRARLKELINKYKSGSPVSTKEEDASKSNRGAKYETLLDLLNFLSQNYSINGTVTVHKRNADVTDNEQTSKSTTPINSIVDHDSSIHPKMLESSSTVYHSEELTPDDIYLDSIDLKSVNLSYFTSLTEEANEVSTESSTVGSTTDETDREDQVKNDTGFISGHVASGTKNHIGDSINSVYNYVTTLYTATVDDSIVFVHNETSDNKYSQFSRDEASEENKHDGAPSVSAPVSKDPPDKSSSEDKHETTTSIFTADESYPDMGPTFDNNY